MSRKRNGKGRISTPPGLIDRSTPGKHAVLWIARLKDGTRICTAYATTRSDAIKRCEYALKYPSVDDDETRGNYEQWVMEGKPVERG